MNHTASSRSSAVALAIVFAAMLAWPTASGTQTVGGRAVGAFIDVPTLGVGPLSLADTGELAADGGWEGAGVLIAQVPSVLTAGVLNTATSGGEYDAGPAANSSSSLGDVTVFPGQAAQLTASFVRSQVEATSAGTTGSVEIENLIFGGIPVYITGVPNQRVEIPFVGTLVINEQTATATTITVNALHLVLATGDQVILANARSVLNTATTAVLLARAASDGSCASSQTRQTIWRPGSPAGPVLRRVWGGEAACIDFVTGGGWFEPPNSTRPGRVNFGFNAGPRSAQNPVLRGHLNLIDHSGELVHHVRGINVTSYVPWGADPANCRVFEGDAVVNGIPGSTYRATVCDYNEPGRLDRFFLELLSGPFAGYFADNKNAACPGGKPECGELDGGNIQLHKSKCPKPATTPLSWRPLRLRKA